MTSKPAAEPKPKPKPKPEPQEEEESSSAEEKSKSKAVQNNRTNGTNGDGSFKVGPPKVSMLIVVLDKCKVNSGHAAERD